MAAIRWIVRAFAWLLGGALIAFGLMGFVVEISGGSKTPNHAMGFAIGVVSILLGVFACLSAHAWHRGGLWTMLGVLLLALGLLSAGFAVDGGIAISRELEVSPAGGPRSDLHFGAGFGIAMAVLALACMWVGHRGRRLDA